MDSVTVTLLTGSLDSTVTRYWKMTMRLACPEASSSKAEHHSSCFRTSEFNELNWIQAEMTPTQEVHPSINPVVEALTEVNV